MKKKKDEMDEKGKAELRHKRKKQQQKRRAKMTVEQIESRRKADRESKQEAKSRQKIIKRTQKRLAKQRERAKQEPGKRRKAYRRRVTVPGNIERFRKFVEGHWTKRAKKWEKHKKAWVDPRTVKWKSSKSYLASESAKKAIAADNLEQASESISSMNVCSYTWSTDPDQRGVKITIVDLRKGKLKTLLSIR